MLGGSNEPKVDSMFIREVPASEFITGAALASQIGLTAGTSQHSDAGWLLFEDPVDGKVKYVAKKPYRHTVTWNHINATGAVFGTKTVTINDKVYKVRLLKIGTTGDVYTGGSGGYDQVDTYGSEWNRLFYPLIPKPISKPAGGLSNEGILYGSLGSYTETDLITDNTAGKGSASWCQETPSRSTGARVFRGNLSVSYVFWVPASYVDSLMGWRPVLELVE